jgi:hypothetical protein
MLRFGILATLIWHYTVDAVLIGTFLLTSDSWYFRASGALVAGAVLFPLAVSLWRYRANGGFLPAERLSNAALTGPEAPRETVPVSSEASEPLAPPAPLYPRRYLYFAACVFLIGGVALSARRYGNFIEVRVDRVTALAAASRALERLQVKTVEWLTVVEFLPNLDASNFEYVRRLRGPEEASRIVAERTLHGVWRVNFFRDRQKEEWYVYVDRAGRAFRTDHVLDEKAPGANLPPAQARRIAEDYLRLRQAVPVEDYRLVDSSSERRERRTDHHFTWEDSRFRVGEATARISLAVLGDEPSSFRRFIKLPEQWLRDYQRVRIRVFLLPALAGAVFLTALIVFIRRLAGHPFRWRLYLGLAATALLVTAWSRLNQLPAFYAGYDTAIPLSDYMSNAIIGAITTSLLASFGVLLAALAIDVFLRLGLRGRPLPRAHLATTTALAALYFGLPAGIAGIAQWIPGDRTSLPLWNLPGAATLAPSFTALGSAIWAAFALCLLAAILAPLAIRVLSLRALAGWVVLIAISISLAAGDSPAMIAYYFIATFATVAILVLVCLTSPAALLSLAPAVFLVESVEGAVALLSQPSDSMRVHGAITLVVALLVVVAWHWRLAAGNRDSRMKAPASKPSQEPV